MFLRDGNAHDAQHNPRNIWSSIKALMRDRSGNFTLTFALTAVPLMVAIGCSFNYVQSVNTHRKMQFDLDAAIVAAVQHVDSKNETALKAEIGKWLEAEAETKGYYVLDTTAIVIDTSNSTIKATVSATVPTTFLKIVGVDAVPVAVSSSVMGGKNATTKNAFSMYLVLDRSGSMGEPTNTSYSTTCYRDEVRKTGAYSCTKYYTKIQALKMAVSDLVNQLATADPDKKYVRTGAASYNDAMQKQTALAWGESAILTYVNALTATGTTDSSAAMAKAYSSLMAATENSQHKAKNGQTPSKYILFMTDGANNVTNADTKTKATCDKARTDNVRVFSIAFMAPTAGQNLLKYCATTVDDYFKAENAAQLIEAFKIIGETSSKTSVRLTQ